ncbi:MARCO-like protein isoform X2 [Prionailurus iriomotensis]
MSSTQALKTSVFKPEEGSEPAFIRQRKHEANHQGEQKEFNKQGGNTQGKQAISGLQGRPGYSNQPGKPGDFNQQGRPGVFNQPGRLQGNSGDSNPKGNSEASNEQGKPGSSSQQGSSGLSSQQGVSGSSSQQRKPGSSSQQGGPGSSSQQGKPGSSNHQGRPGLSSQQGKSRPFYNQEERKNAGNPLNTNIMEVQVTSGKGQTITSHCLVIDKIHNVDHIQMSKVIAPENGTQSVRTMEKLMEIHVLSAGQRRGPSYQDPRLFETELEVEIPATMMNSCTFLASSLLIAIFLLLIPGDFCVKIIGGNQVTPHSRPYMVLLKGESICAGALIEKNWVLTAAHCVLNRMSQVILGAHSITKNEPEKQIMFVKKQYPYPCFDQDTHEGDLKLLQGDSGSPLICEGTYRGITAFGLPGKCGDPRGPGIYTLLSQKYLNWINKTMKGQFR